VGAFLRDGVEACEHVLKSCDLTASASGTLASRSDSAVGDVAHVLDLLLCLGTKLTAETSARSERRGGWFGVLQPSESNNIINI
jgi:hypothetical protein